MPTVHKYGPSESQFVRVWEPARKPAGGSPVALCIHGGYWRKKYTIDNALFDTVAPDLAARGFVAVDVEYRRCGEAGGGWPGTNNDVLAALAMVPGLQGCDAARVVVVGHSAGGCLALWLADAAARRRTIDPSFPVPCVACAVAPVADLHLGHKWKISDDGKAVSSYMQGTPEDKAAEYLSASPRALLPLRTPALITIGTRDDQVPPELVTEYASAARAAGGPHECRVVEFPGADHFCVVEASAKEWKQTAAELEARVFGRARL
eukprot:TRINITY_DN37365_c0_g1_i1.p1 TRINITY_DN37365_c0_g1~~TRINITY_DN37365_c0_g1_i1.p1  ORF type:complete len:264 (+),score=74.18 TRINITY_DN37365_c0_g1_i1:58-849(+)